MFVVAIYDLVMCVALAYCTLMCFQGITMSSRQLLVTPALERSNADKLRKDKKDTDQNKDKTGRNLWLAREGCKSWTDVCVSTGNVDL